MTWGRAPDLRSQGITCGTRDQNGAVGLGPQSDLTHGAGIDMVAPIPAGRSYERKAASMLVTPTVRCRR
jgi:hypothetical protein